MSLSLSPSATSRYQPPPKNPRELQPSNKLARLPTKTEDQAPHQVQDVSQYASMHQHERTELTEYYNNTFVIKNSILNQSFHFSKFSRLFQTF